MENQTTPLYSEQITQATGAFTAFGIPQQIFMDGADITTEVVEKFGSIDAWLHRLVVVFNNFRVTVFAIARINGVVKLYVKSVY